MMHQTESSTKETSYYGSDEELDLTSTKVNPIMESVSLQQIISPLDSQETDIFMLMLDKLDKLDIKVDMINSRVTLMEEQLKLISDAVMELERAFRQFIPPPAGGVDRANRINRICNYLLQSVRRLI